jgi:anaerobic selenocysteine-containing dehydrogenase
MTSRRDFIKISALVTGGMLIAGPRVAKSLTGTVFKLPSDLR